MTQPLLVVSPRKSGTHLVAKLLDANGYRIHGDVAASDVTSERLHGERLLAVLNAVYRSDELRPLTREQDPERVSTAAAIALEAYYAAWRSWMGAPRPLVQDARSPAAALARRLLAAGDEGWSEQPDGFAWIVHEFDPTSAHPRFIADWLEGRGPRFVLAYRDPRDCLVSMVRFLTADGPDEQVGNFPEHRIYREILRAARSLDAQLTIALTDPLFPGLSGFRHCVWLRHHPRVLTLRYEDLAGAAAGGNDDSRRRTVSGFLDAIGSAVAVDDVLSRLSRASFTFRSGRIGSHREVFSAAHHRLFERHHGQLLEHFGPATDSD